jgi:hypothetical protein
MTWVYLGVAILFGLFLYWLRCHQRVLYGSAEIIVAFFLLYFFFSPEGYGVLATGPAGHFDVWGALLSRGVTLFGGLYALVRGLDNVDALGKWNWLRRQHGPGASSDPKPPRQLPPKVYAPPKASAARRRRR